MNLTDLTHTAQCKECSGSGGVRDPWTRKLYPDVKCPRCKAHPGIDPDVVSTIQIESGYHYSSARPVVVVPLEDTDDN